MLALQGDGLFEWVIKVEHAADWVLEKSGYKRNVCKTIGAILLIAPYFRPEYIMFFGGAPVKAFFLVWSIVAMSISIVLVVLRGKASTPFLLTVSLPLAILVSTLVNGGSLEIWLYQWGACIGVAALVFAGGKSNIRWMLWAMLSVTSVLVFTNLVFCFVFPNGSMWDPYPAYDKGMYTFFSHRNQIFQIALPAIVSSSVLDEMLGKRLSLRSVVLWVASIITIALAPSVTSALSLAFLLVVLLLRRFSLARRFLNAATYGIASCFAFLSTVVFRFQELLGDNLFAVVGKDASFSGRLGLWDKALHLLEPSQYLFGIGMKWTYIPRDGRLFSAHNQFLHVLCIGGIVGTLCFLGTLLVAVICLYRARGSRIAYLLAAALGAYFVIGIAETAISVGYWFVIAMAMVYGIKKKAFKST